MISRNWALCGEIVASLVVIVVAYLAWLRGKTPKMRRLVLYVWNLT